MSAASLPGLVARGLAAVLADGRRLYRNADLDLPAGVSALVGRNGIGKSTLLRQLAGRVAPAAGEVLRAGRIHLLKQDAAARAGGRVADVLGVGDALDALARLEAGSGTPEDLACLDDRWDLRLRVAGALDAAGLGHLDPAQAVAALSGGERQGLCLLAALRSDADVLLLDEPTNHLDAAASARWYALFAARPGACLVATHDPAWLRRLDRVHELTPEGIVRSDGGLEGWRAQRSARLAAQADALEAAHRARAQARREVARERERLDRRRARGDRAGRESNQARILLDASRDAAERSQSKARSALSETLAAADAGVREAFAMSEPLAAPSFVDAPVALPDAARVLSLEAVHPIASHPSRALTLHLGGPVRVGLEGPNGSGKSSLLRAIAGRGAVAAGRLHAHVPVRLLDQHLDHLPLDQHALDWLQRESPGTSAAVLSNRLALLGLPGPRARLPVGVLSGGERMRLAIAGAAWARPAAPFLLLDEPGNHLDLDSREALVALLRAWPGALLVVSHDPALLDALALDRRLRLDAARFEEAVATA
ncbi:ATP-binding cassette domain-containing protein [Coralloluteibacterium thermophilus]|uniref:ATP-binding cassette domain-containing protein n=1 Tax=Coralloluteibacterium thermophilum TaxID=2707049 RepID=A0ABV9NQ49_9GAMM